MTGSLWLSVIWDLVIGIGVIIVVVVGGVSWTRVWSWSWWRLVSTVVVRDVDIATPCRSIVVTTAVRYVVVAAAVRCVVMVVLVGIEFWSGAVDGVVDGNFIFAPYHYLDK